MSKRVTTIYLPSELLNKVRLQEMNLSKFVTNVLRNYFAENIDAIQLDESIRETKLRLEVLEAKKREREEFNKKREKLLDYLTLIKKADRTGAPDRILIVDYEGAKELGYTGSFEDFKKVILK